MNIQEFMMWPKVTTVRGQLSSFGMKHWEGNSEEGNGYKCETWGFISGMGHADPDLQKCGQELVSKESLLLFPCWL